MKATHRKKAAPEIEIMEPESIAGKIISKQKIIEGVLMPTISKRQVLPFGKTTCAKKRSYCFLYLTPACILYFMRQV